MKKDDTVSLRHILDAVCKIVGYTEGVTYAQYLRNDMMQETAWCVNLRSSVKR